MDCSVPGFPVLHYVLNLLKFMSVELAMLSNHLILCHLLLLLLSIFPSLRILVSKLILCIRWPKYWSFSISPSNGYSGLISFRMDWFDLLAVHGTLESLLQNHTSKASIISYELTCCGMVEVGVCGIVILHPAMDSSNLRAAFFKKKKKKLTAV